jgi:hypothetical protein
MRFYAAERWSFLTTFRCRTHGLVPLCGHPPLQWLPEKVGRYLQRPPDFDDHLIRLAVEKRAEQYL